MKYESAEGRVMLKSVGIIMVISGVWSLSESIRSITYLFAAPYTSEFSSPLNYLSENNGTLLIFSFVMGVTVCLAEIIAGSIGIVFCNKPTKAQVCVITAIILFVLIFLRSVTPASFSVSDMGVDKADYILDGVGTGIISSFYMLLSMNALPVLFLIGAIQNKRSTCK